MSDTAVAAYVNEPPNVHIQLTSQVTLDRLLPFYDLSDPAQVGFGELPDPGFPSIPAF